MMNTFIIVNIAPICRSESLENKSMLLVHFKKAYFPALSLYLGTHLAEELYVGTHLAEELLTDYCFVLKVTTVFPIPTQAK